jgi:Conserved TM helix
MPQTNGDLASALGQFVPRLVGAVVVLLAALVVAQLLQRLVARFLERLGLDDLFGRTGAADALWRLGYGGGPSSLSALSCSGASCSPGWLAP